MFDDLTIEELKDRLSTQFDPDDLVELLRVSAKNLVDAFEDRVELYYERLIEELG